MSFFRRRRELDARVADARARAEEAEREAAKSRARYESVREHVVEPLRQYAEENNFAAMIRDSIRRGYEKGAPP